MSASKRDVFCTYFYSTKGTKGSKSYQRNGQPSSDPFLSNRDPITSSLLRAKGKKDERTDRPIKHVGYM